MSRVRVIGVSVLLTAVAVAGGSGAGVAIAANSALEPYTDSLVPSYNYDHACQRGTGPNTGTVCQTDNGTVTVWIEASISSQPYDTQNVKLSLDGSYDPISNIDIVYATTKVTSGSGETDIIYQEGDMPAGSNIVGSVWCDDPVDGATYNCDQQYVRFLKTYSVYRSLACHETGHAIGLLHGPDSSPYYADTSTVIGCMRRPDTSTNTGGTAALGSNNVTNIHETY